MRSSTCWNQAEKLQEKAYRTDWPHIWIPALSEVDLETSTKREANRTKAIVSLYWLSQSFHLKEPRNQTKNKSTKADPIISSRTSKNSDEISISYAAQDIKTYFPENKRSTNPHDWGYKWVVTPKGKTKSKPLARLKVRIFSKTVVGF